MEINERLSYLNTLNFNVTKEILEENSRKTVVVGMSGGVDSSACAILVKLLGYNTLGMFMRNWEEIGVDGVCSAEEEYADVIRVCDKIDIPYYSINFSEEYKNFVFKEFVKEYELGHTPNPDILCNREIKFKVFLNKVKEFGADYLATGHYCQKSEKEGRTFLGKGFDKNKDQSYFLYAIKEDALQDVLFPIGHIEKKQVRKIAKDFDLSTHDKKDSTGICFIGERHFKNFLSQYIKSLKGEFVHLETNKKLGDHDGMCFYTIGQRKGLGLGGPGGPWFVAKKDISKNIVYIVEGEEHPALYSHNLIASEITWISKAPVLPLECRAKIRYRQKDQDCTVSRVNGEVFVQFEKAQRAISKGQSIVFYQNDICLGGAIINTSGKTLYELS